MFGGGKQVCQFYLRGDCKYGSKCWHSHAAVANSNPNVFGGASNSTTAFSGNSSYFGGNSSSSSFGGGFQNDIHSASQNKQFIEFIKQVISEMDSWEKNGTWLLSSLAPLKDHPRLDGFIDTSQEELRVAAYEALKSNDTATYERIVSEKLKYHKELRQQIKDQKTEALKALKDVFFKTSSASSTESPFNKKETPSLFSKPSVGQTSMFGGTTAGQSQNLFGISGSAATATNIFGGKPQSSAFGAASVFGELGSNESLGGGGVDSAFKSQVTSGGGIFGGNAVSDASPFASSTVAPTQGSSLFPPAANETLPGFGVNSTFASGASNSAFNKPSESSTGALQMQRGTFATSNSSGFGSAPTNSGGIFPSATSMNNTGGSIFGVSAPQPNVFGVNTTIQQSVTGSPFVNNNQSNLNVFGINQQKTDLAPSSFNIFASGAKSVAEKESPANLFEPSNNLPISNVSTIMPASTPDENVILPNQQSSTFEPSTNVFGTDLYAPISAVDSSSSTTRPSDIFSNSQQIANSVENCHLIANPNGLQRVQPSNLFSNPQDHSKLTNDNSQLASNLFGTTESAVETPSRSKIYTPMELLSDEDKLEFQKQFFTRIPIVPPPKELCL